jgi:hypothetical protein
MNLPFDRVLIYIGPKSKAITGRHRHMARAAARPISLDETKAAFRAAGE